MPAISRRQFTKRAAAFLLGGFASITRAQEQPDFQQLKAGYAQRLKKMLGSSTLPYIDIESSCNPARVDISAIAQAMDRLNIGLMALSSDIGRNQFDKGIRFDNFSHKLLSNHADRFIPVGNGGQPPALTEAAPEFLDAQAAAAQQKKILLFGEYEFRHYPSPRQVKRGDAERDVDVPIDSPTGHKLFGISERTGLAFQIHCEIEDAYLPPLEKMLAQYPKARVIWCHLAQVRYIERNTRYNAGYVDTLIKRFPNLYFDTAFADERSVYPLSGQRHARIWASDGDISREWRDLIVAHPRRFLSALDLGQDRMERIAEHDRRHRQFLSRLPLETRHHVAYRSAWSLLFGEEFP
jgi:hypothetical protein